MLGISDDEFFGGSSNKPDPPAPVSAPTENKPEQRAMETVSIYRFSFAAI
jgi:hypothetical protein